MFTLIQFLMSCLLVVAMTTLSVANTLRPHVSAGVAAVYWLFTLFTVAIALLSWRELRDRIRRG